jgi:hypothetical protein
MNPRGNTHAPRGFGGLTPQEAAIMAQWDAGRSMQAIARSLALSPRRVEATVSCYDGKADHAQFRRETQEGSATLLAAIAHHFPQRLRPERVEGIAA